MAAKGAPILPKSLLNITVRDEGMSFAGIDYEVQFKSTLPCFTWEESTVRRTQKEFSWLFRELKVASQFSAPFGESADSTSEMQRLEDILLQLASNPLHQNELVLHVFFRCPSLINSSITAEQLQREEEFLSQCTEETLEAYSLDQIKELALRHGLTSLESYDDRDYYVERIVMHSKKKLQSDLDDLEVAVQALDGSWGTHKTVPAAPVDHVNLAAFRNVPLFAGQATATSSANPTSFSSSNEPVNLDDVLAALENPVETANDNIAQQLQQ